MSFGERIAELLRSKQWIPSRCPICSRPLMAHKQGKKCDNDHYFGPDGKRVDLINSGHHHGQI